VVVVGKLDPGRLRLLRRLVGVGGDLLVSIERVAVAVRKVRNHQMAQPRRLGLVEDLHEIGHAFVLRIHDAVPLEMAGMDRQAGRLGAIDQRLAIREAVGLHLLVTGRGDRLQRPGRVLGEGVAQGVELDPDVLAMGIVGREGGKQAAGRAQGERRGGGGAEKSAAFHAGRLAGSSVRRKHPGRHRAGIPPW